LDPPPDPEWPAKPLLDAAGLLVAAAELLEVALTMP
jgi:hypothetical protein